MKFDINPKVSKILITGAGLLLTGIGSMLGEKVKTDNQKETIKELIKEELKNQAKES